MLAQERFERILEILREKQSVTVVELTEKTEHLRVHDTKGFNGIKPTRSFDQGSWRSYCDQVCVIKRRRSHNQVKETPGREAKDCKICSIFDQ